MVNWLVACLLALFVIVRCEREEQFKLSVDCSKYGNGNYVFGCNPHYWVCANNLQHELRCYGELVLDPDENRCNYREKVRLCTDPNLPRDQPYRALELFTCYDKPNGLYSTGFCDSFFYSCINGTKNDFPCPNQQVFDNSTKKCDLREVVDECKPGNLRPRPLATPAVSIKSQGSSKVPSKPDESPRPLAKILPSGSKMSISAPLSTINFANQTASASNPTQPETVIDCSQLPDGSYEVDKGVCSNKFWKCGNKLASYYQCPPGLFFNVDNKQCDFVENVVACGGTSGVRSKAGSADDIFGTGRDAPLLPVTTTNKPMADFNCTGKVDGIYIERGCQSSYVQCTGGKVEQKTCPQGQLLDPFVADCRPKEECGATTRVPRNDIAPSPLEHGNFDYYSQQTNPPMSTFNCQGRADGFYELGSCQKNYVRCISNQAISHECPMDLVFFNNICDHVQRCLNPSAFTPAPLLSLQSLGQDSSRIADVQYYGQQQQYDTTTTPPDPWCRQNNKPDGFHGVGCAPYFYSCTLGFSTKIPCPDGLFYSPDDHQCENRDFIPACGGKKPETTTPPPMDAPRYTTPKDVWCQHFNMPDGIHGLKGCKNYYYSCNGGFSIRINCPSGLFYDYELQQCSHREWIPDCGGTRPLPTTTVPPHLNPTTPASTYCRDHKLSDGLHGAGCNNFFYACNGGFSTRLTCPGNLYFDETEQHCTNQEWIVACGGQKPTTLPPQLNPPMPTTPPDTWCRQNNKPDGLHGLGCANYFYACNGGFSTRLTCPGNLYFDETEQQCTNKEWIVACGGQKPTTLPPQLNPPMPTTPPDMWCQQNRKSDGFHGLGCANYFYNCNSGFSLRINCPSGLFYDPETHECNNRAFIPACGGKKPETTTPPPMDAPRYTTPKDVWCQHFNMPDGIHGLKGCKNYYYSCNGGFSIRINCPTGLFYDYELQQCSHREWIPDCGGSRPLPTTTVPPQLNPTTPADTYCRDHKLSDGLHGAGCNNFFYACNGEVSTRISCPSGLYFDSQFHECTNRAWIAACGGQRPITTTTAQPMFNPTTADPWCRINQKPDGFHGEKCNSYFYSCSAGTTTKISCPDGLFYDVDEHQCNNRNLIVACGGKKPAPMARAPQMSYQPRMIAPSSPQQSPYAQQPVAVPQQSPPQPPSSSYASVQQSGPRNAVALNVPPESLPLTPDNSRNPCAKLPNGIYGRRCSRHFFVCTNHSTVDFICPNNQAYDARVNKCADKSQITTCASSYGPNTRYY